MFATSGILTYILLIFTGYYAYTTSKMLKYQEAVTLLETRPFLAFDGLHINLYYANNIKSTA